MPICRAILIIRYILSLHFQQETFRLQSAGIADQLMVAADDPMAWDQYGDGIGAVGGGDGPDGLGVADRLGQLRVGTGFAIGNSLELLPDQVLERGAGEEQR